MIITAFDLATATGVCDGAVGSGKPRLFTWFLDDAGSSRPARLLCLDTFLRSYFESQPCDGVVYEAPMPVGMIGEQKRQRVVLSEANVALARGLIGVLEMNCAKARKPVASFPVQAARVSTLGWRTNRVGSGKIIVKRDGTLRDETAKERVVREVKMIGIDAQNDNEADAYVMWQYACNKQNARLAIASTPLFRSGET